MMKKISLFCLIIVMIMTSVVCVPFASATETEVVSESSEIKFLKAIGILDDELAMDTPVTRGVFAKYTARLLGEVPESTAAAQNYFDVTADADYCNGISLLTKVGLLNGYGDGTFLTKEAIYEEVRQTLTKFPNLKITFPHFFFLSDHLDEAKKLFDKYPNLKLDITPGREMYDNFTRHHEKSKEIFNEYSNRIILGTDMTSTHFQGEPGDMINTITRFLSTEDEFSYWDFDIKGIGLSEEKCKQICHDNFLSNLSDEPKPINKTMLKAYIDRFLPLVKNKETAAFIADFYKNNL